MAQTAEQLNSVAQSASRPPVMWQIVERVEKDATIKMIKFPEALDAARDTVENEKEQS